MTQSSISYSHTLEFLYSRLPMFHRIGAAAYKANLDNTHAICDLLGHPENKFRSIHIAGTNGKGSTSHMLAAILQTAGYKTGLYTSPHLRDFRERIRIDGKMIPEKAVMDFVDRYRADFEKIEPSFFEWTVGLAFDYFAKEKVDVAVIETGLGGRLDSTNVITPELCIITNIGRDHMNLLGDTVQKIAAEKAGIIKQGIPVVIGKEQMEVKEIFLQKAAGMKAPIYFADARFESEVSHQDEFLNVKVNEFESGTNHYYSLDQKGLYQAQNLTTVLMAVHELKLRGWKIDPAHVSDALKQVGKLTGLGGRWQTIGRSPLTIADVGHNEDGLAEVLECIRHTPHRKLHFVFGVVIDKNIDGMLDLLPAAAHYYFCKANTPRSMEAEALKERAAVSGLKGEAYASVQEALDTARLQAGIDDLVVVTGSTFVVAEVIGIEN